MNAASPQKITLGTDPGKLLGKKLENTDAHEKFFRELCGSALSLCCVQTTEQSTYLMYFYCIATRWDPPSWRQSLNSHYAALTRRTLQQLYWENCYYNTEIV